MIAIDHGNKQIKCAHKVFTSGILESDTRPPLGEEILIYKGKYYTLSDKRIPYMRDKTADERFFFLTLFAIAYEIEATDCYSDDEVMDIQLVVGLPPAHYGSQYKKFEQYFSKRDIVDFEFRGRTYSIYISEVTCFPQAYAAAMPVYNRIKDFPKAIVIDIGGFTADYLQIKKGNPDLSVCDSLENGVIVLYNKILSKINADFDLLLEESDIDSILIGDATDFDAKIISVVTETAEKFISDLFSNLRERMIDLKTGKTVFVGGGSILLKSIIEASGKVQHPIFVDEITANSRGYEYLYKASKARR